MVFVIKTLADAARDHRVALANAERAYEVALQRAAATAAVAQRAADGRWRAACAQARGDAVARRSLRATYRGMRDDQLTAMLRRLEYMLSPVYAQHLDRAAEPRIRMYAGMARNELERRNHARR